MGRPCRAYGFITDQTHGVAMGCESPAPSGRKRSDYSAFFRKPAAPAMGCESPAPCRRKRSVFPRPNGAFYPQPRATPGVHSNKQTSPVGALQDTQRSGTPLVGRKRSDYSAFFKKTAAPAPGRKRSDYSAFFRKPAAPAFGADLLRFGLEQGAAIPQARAPQKGHIALPFFPSSPNARASRMSIDALIANEQAAPLEEDHAHGSHLRMPCAPSSGS